MPRVLAVHDFVEEKLRRQQDTIRAQGMWGTYLYIIGTYIYKYMYREKVRERARERERERDKLK